MEDTGFDGFDEDAMALSRMREERERKAAETNSNTDTALESVPTLESKSEEVKSSGSTPDQEACVIDCSAMAPVNVYPSRELDADEISELSSRFADALSLVSPQSETVVEHAPEHASEPKIEASDPEVVAAERKRFNEGMEVISRIAEDVVKTWFAQMYNKPVLELFPDGLIGHVGSIRMTPTEELLSERRKARRPPDEETRDGDPEDPEDALGWELKLQVVGPEHRINLLEWRNREPAVLAQMQGLLKTAWGYIQYALESYGLPNPELFKDKVIPSPWGTLYVLGAPDTASQIGISIERPKPELIRENANEQSRHDPCNDPNYPNVKCGLACGATFST